jgi:CarD family transcriptional regulator
MFVVGDTVVYPQHGAGRIVDMVDQDFQGELRSYFLIEILHNQMTVMVPVDGLDKAGIRAVITEQEVEELVAVLRDDATHMPVNWSRRVRHNRDKIKTGDIFEIADVLRNLALRDCERGLSTGEKQMFGKVRRIMASELMVAKVMSEDEALQFLDTILGEACAQQDTVGGE